MKRLFLFVLAFFLTAFFINDSNSQVNQIWQWAHPKPQGNTFRFVKMINTTSWFAVGYSGTFMKTTNSGANWTIYTNAGGIQAGTGLGRTLYSGWFFDANNGLVCGSSGWIGRTTNGGVSWDSISSGSTGTLYGIRFINASTGFIGGTSGTVLKSTNAGLTWTAIPTGGTLSIYNIYALDVNRIYAPTSSSGNMLVTTNGGANWTTVATGGVTLYDANFINPNTGFVCGSSGNVRVTFNGGTNWAGVNPGGTSAFYELLSVVGNLVPSTPYSEGFENVSFPPAGWRAVNVAGPVVWVRTTSQYHSGAASAFINYDCSGMSYDWLITPQWSIMSGDSLVFWLRTNDNGYPPDSLAVRVSTTDTALASFTNRILYIAEGAGYPAAGVWGRYAASLNPFAGQNIYIGFKHADNCGDGIFVDDVAVNRLAQAVDVYAVGDAFNIYKTTNLGTNWTAVNHLDPAQPWTSTWYSMDLNGSVLTAVGANGLFNVSTNGGTNWTTKTTWLSAGTFYDVWCEFGTGKVWAVGSPGSSGSSYDQVLYSANGGNTWSNQNVGTSIQTYRAIKMINATTGFITGSGSIIRKTTNGGTTWDSLATSIPAGLTFYAIDFINATTGWVFSNTTNTGGTIWKTTNGGSTWGIQDMGVTGSDSRIYAADMVDANTGYLVNYTPRPYKTTNGGVNWTVQTISGTFGGYLYDICMLDANIGYTCGSAGKLFKTINGGTLWDTVTTPYNTTYYSTEWATPVSGYLVGSSGYTARSTNGGQSWEMNTTSGSTLYKIYMKTADTGYVVGSLSYIFKWQRQPSGIATWNNEVPTSFFLSQNYPNPFNPATTIKFGIPKASKVTVNVYDITGRLVMSLFNNAPLNPGTVTYNFDGSNLASGVYFYTLFADNNRIDTKKMILLK